MKVLQDIYKYLKEIRFSILVMSIAPFMVLIEQGSGYTVMSIRVFLALYGIFYLFEYIFKKNKLFLCKEHLLVLLYMLAFTLTTIFIKTYNSSWLSNIFVCGLFFMLLSQRLSSKEIKHLANSYILVTLLICVKLFWQRQMYQDFYGRHTISFMSSQGLDPNYLSSLMLMPILIMLYRVFEDKDIKRKILWLVMYGFSSVAVVYIGSRSALVFLLIGSFIIGMWFLLSNKIKLLHIILAIIALAIVAVVVLMFLPDSIRSRFIGYNYLIDSGNQDRISVWIACLKMMVESPLIGLGLGCVFPLSQRYGALRRMLAHNTWLDVGASTGLCGLIPFAWLTVGMFIKTLKVKTLPLTAIMFVTLSTACLINSQDVPYFGRSIIFVFFILEYLKEDDENKLSDVLL